MNFLRGARGIQRNVARRSMSSQPFGSLPTSLYQGVWRKSNILYITYVVVGCVAIEVVYGSVTTKIWENANAGVSIFASVWGFLGNDQLLAFAPSWSFLLPWFPLCEILVTDFLPYIFTNLFFNAPHPSMTHAETISSGRLV